MPSLEHLKTSTVLDVNLGSGIDEKKMWKAVLVKSEDRVIKRQLLRVPSKVTKSNGTDQKSPTGSAI